MSQIRTQEGDGNDSVDVVATQSTNMFDILSQNDPDVSATHENGGSVFTQSDPNNDSQWTRVSNERKRPRISTGSDGTSESTQHILAKDFQNLSVDNKLIVLFSDIGRINGKVDQCLSIHTKVKNLEHRVDDHETRITFLEYKSLDLEARSRRNNLIFSGLPESRNEDCTQTIANFLKSNLGIDPCPQIPRVHRLGRYNRDKTRPIIAFFLDYRDTENVISKANRLKGSSFSINRDFPKEIATARQKLWPAVKKLRQDFPGSKVSLVYPAKVVRDGRVVSDMFPDWNRALARNRVQTANDVGQAPNTNVASLESSAASGTMPNTSSHVTQATRNQHTRSGVSIHQSRSHSRSARGTASSRDRAPSRPRSNSANTPGNATGTDPQFRPWDDGDSSTSRSQDGAARG